MNHPLRLRALTFAMASSLVPSLAGVGLLSGAGIVSAASTNRSYDIPAGTLRDVLNRFGHESKLLLSYPADQVAGLHSQGLRGDYSVEAGLAVLLSGTGLTAIALPNGSYTLQHQAGVEGGMTLPVSTISGRAEQSITGPIDGIVANRSSVGTKTNAAISEVPQSISVITRDEMNKRGVQDFNSAVAYTPGIRAIDYVGGQARRISTCAVSVRSTCSGCTGTACAAASTSTTPTSKPTAWNASM